MSMLATVAAFAQTGKVGINTSSPKASLDINGKTGNTTADVEDLLHPSCEQAKSTFDGWKHTRSINIDLHQ